MVGHIKPITTREHVFAFWFVNAERLRDTKADSLPNHQDIMKWPGWLTMRTLDLRLAVPTKSGAQSAYQWEHVAVSHRWPATRKPDEGGIQLRELIRFLHRYPQIKWVWLDYLCLPQVPRTSDEEAFFRASLQHMHLLFLSCHVLALGDLQYIGRFWPCWEVFLSLRTLGPLGLEDTPEGLERVSMCFPQAESNHGTFIKKVLLEMWGRGITVEKAFHQLLKEQVYVTNKSDKDEQLKTFQDLNNEVAKLYDAIKNNHELWQAIAAVQTDPMDRLDGFLENVGRLFGDAPHISFHAESACGTFRPMPCIRTFCRVGFIVFNIVVYAGMILVFVAYLPEPRDTHDRVSMPTPGPPSITPTTTSQLLPSPTLSREDSVALVGNAISPTLSREGSVAAAVAAVLTTVLIDACWHCYDRCCRHRWSHKPTAGTSIADLRVPIMQQPLLTECSDPYRDDPHGAKLAPFFAFLGDLTKEQQVKALELCEQWQITDLEDFVRHSLVYDFIDKLCLTGSIKVEAERFFTICYPEKKKAMTFLRCFIAPGCLLRAGK